MSVTATQTASTAQASAPSIAKSEKFRNFAATFSISGTLTYLVCLWWNLPMVTYHPATNKLGWGWEPAPSGEGPAMYWYGWTANVLVVATVLGLLATLLPNSVGKKIPLWLTWLLPIVSLPLVIYTLMPLLGHK
jgi:hypothetical protein